MAAFREENMSVGSVPGAPARANNGNGHLLNTMDNVAFERDQSGETPSRVTTIATTMVELGELAGGGPPPGPPGPRCKPDLCMAMAVTQFGAKPAAMRPNPWHRYKTILLVCTIAGLIIWVLAYAMLQYFQVLT